MKKIEVWETRPGIKEVIIRDTETGVSESIPYYNKITNVSSMVSLIIPSNYQHEFDQNAYKALSRKDRKIKFYRQVGDYLGCSCSTFMSLLNGAIYRAYIEPHNDLINRFATVNKGQTRYREKDLVERVHENFKLYQYYKDDGLDHLAGFGVLLGLTTEKARKVIGKNGWARICKNSRTRNDKICILAVTLDYMGQTDESLKPIITFLNSVPSTILSKFYDPSRLLSVFRALDGNHLLFKKVIEYIKQPLYKIEISDITQIAYRIGDTIMMCRDLGINFDYNWSINRIFRVHDEAAHQKLKMTASSEQFTICEFLPNQIQKDQFTATLCKSELEMAELGMEQHHCVGNYAGVVGAGLYAVYKIVNDLGEISTLGITHPKCSYITQHYHSYNGIITDEERVRFAVTIVNKVSKLLFENVKLEN